jgi:nucleolar protein 56
MPPQARNKGRISRYLANKCSIASRIDAFGEIATSAFGAKLREQVEERLAFYDKGVAPTKNVVAMAAAMADAGLISGKKKKEKKRKAAEVEAGDDAAEGAEAAAAAAKAAKKAAKKAKKAAAEA